VRPPNRLGSSSGVVQRSFRSDRDVEDDHGRRPVQLDLGPVQRGVAQANGHPRYQGVCFAAAAPASEDMRDGKSMRHIGREPRYQRQGR
jgi:hypothetical protein